MNWTYTESDPALRLFTAARERFGLQLPEHARVLELGCAETTFLERLKAQNPTFDLWGVDVREDRTPHNWTFIRGSAFHVKTWEPHLFPNEWFDGVVMLGALEHFGLGYYGDPVLEDGDTLTMMNVVRSLKPGGWVYFDVPFAPQGFRVAENRHFRHYDDQAVTDRLIVPGLCEVHRAYSDCEPHAGTWVERPTCDKVPYWFVAVHAVKEG